MIKYLKILTKLNFNTVYFNFKYLPFKDAIKFPILLSKHVHLKEVSGKINFECPIRHDLVRFGYGEVGIFDNRRSRSIWEVSGTVVFKGKTDIGHGSKISVGDNGILKLGANFTITAETAIIAFFRVEFGDDCLLSWNILIIDIDFHKIKNEFGKILNNPKPILFGNKIWVGCRSSILKGTIVPNNCVIGANSFINRELTQENALYGGNPIKLLKEKISWEL